MSPASLTCGDQVTSDLTLDNDLSCAGDGMVVMADGITLNLNGHTIAGDGTGNGITIRARTGVTIKGGTVRNFVTGIFVAQSAGVVIKDNGFTQNREAVFFNGTSSSVVKANAAWSNSSRGIMLRPTAGGIISTGNEIVDNVLTDNPSGILVFGQPGNTLKGNTITGSALAALDLTGGGATGNEIKQNILAASAAGIKFGTGWTGNSFIGNSLLSNICGIQGPGEDNTYKDNILSGNTTDACP